MVTNALVFFVKDHVIILGAVRFLFGERNIAVKFISSCPTSFYDGKAFYKSLKCFKAFMIPSSSTEVVTYLAAA